MLCNYDWTEISLSYEFELPSSLLNQILIKLMVCWTLATRLLWSFHDMIWIAFNTVLFYAAWWPSGMGGGWGLLSVVVFVLGAFYSWFSFLHVYCVVELTECTDFWNNFAPPIQYLLIYFGLTYFTALLCLSLTISWSVRNFNAGCSFQGAKKNRNWLFCL